MMRRFVLITALLFFPLIFPLVANAQIKITIGPLLPTNDQQEQGLDHRAPPGGISGAQTFFNRLGEQCPQCGTNRRGAGAKIEVGDGWQAAIGTKQPLKPQKNFGFSVGKKF